MMISRTPLYTMDDGFCKPGLAGGTPSGAPKQTKSVVHGATAGFIFKVPPGQHESNWECTARGSVPRQGVLNG